MVDPHSGGDSGAPSRAGHRVELVRSGGHEETIQVEPGDSVVDAATAAGVDLPYGCLYGSCGTCAAAVLEGELAYLERPRALKSAARDEGYVLACIATPVSACRLRVGHGIQAEVVGTPWK